MYSVGEYGQNIYFNVEEDIAANTNQILLKKPNGTEVYKTASVGTSNFNSTTKGLFKANQYMYYLVAQNDIDVSGHWEIRAITKTPGGALKKSPWLKAIVKD